jgi:hypothetical protein
MRWASILILTAALGLAGCASSKARPKPSKPHIPRAAHAEVDTNDDGYVDHEEFHQRMVEIFYFGDTDKDGHMSYVETDRVVVFSRDWEAADINGDGRISLYEFLRIRFRDFEEVDGNSDGVLSVDEVVAAFGEEGSK